VRPGRDASAALCRARQQPQSPQDIQRQLVQQRREERPITRSEPHLFLTKLALQHSDLMAWGKALGVLGPVTIGSRRSMANVFVTPRYASLSSTVDHHAAAITSQAMVPARTVADNIRDTRFTSSHLRG
jgi:hypothetical protein